MRWIPTCSQWCSWGIQTERSGRNHCFGVQMELCWIMAIFSFPHPYFVSVCSSLLHFLLSWGKWCDRDCEWGLQKKRGEKRQEWGRRDFFARRGGFVASAALLFLHLSSRSPVFLCFSSDCIGVNTHRDDVFWKKARKTEREVSESVLWERWKLEVAFLLSPFLPMGCFLGRLHYCIVCESLHSLFPRRGVGGFFSFFEGVGGERDLWYSLGSIHNTDLLLIMRLLSKVGSREISEGMEEKEENSWYSGWESSVDTSTIVLFLLSYFLAVPSHNRMILPTSLTLFPLHVAVQAGSRPGSRQWPTWINPRRSRRDAWASNEERTTKRTRNHRMSGGRGEVHGRDYQATSSFNLRNSK